MATGEHRLARSCLPGAMASEPVEVLGFSHVCIAVSDAERSLGFYRDLLGMHVFFDVSLDGPSMEAVTGEADAAGRMVGGLLGGTVVELLEFSHRALASGGAGGHARLGYTNLSLSVRDLDEAHRRFAAAGVAPEQEPVEIGGVRMFFVRDPDGTPVELVQYPNGERTSAEMWGAT